MKKTIVNFEWIFMIVITLLLSFVFYLVFNKSIIVSFVSLIVVLFLHLTTPNRFEFDELGFVIHYGFAFKITTLWGDIHKIWTVPVIEFVKRPLLLPSDEYRFTKFFGKENKFCFFMKEAIPKTKKTTIEIKKHFKGIIEE